MLDFVYNSFFLSVLMKIRYCSDLYISPFETKLILLFIFVGFKKNCCPCYLIFTPSIKWDMVHSLFCVPLNILYSAYLYLYLHLVKFFLFYNVFSFVWYSCNNLFIHQVIWSNISMAWACILINTRSLDLYWWSIVN